MAGMEQDGKIQEAQVVLTGAILFLNGTINCKVIEYKKGIYRVHFFRKDNTLIMPVQVNEDWITGSDPGKSVIHDRLKMLLINLERQ